MKGALSSNIKVSISFLGVISQNVFEHAMKITVSKSLVEDNTARQRNRNFAFGILLSSREPIGTHFASLEKT